MTETIEFALQGAEAPEDRPRERLLSAGAATLDTADLLAVLLGTGTAGRPVETFARELLETVGGLRCLAGFTPIVFASLPGLGDARAARILASLELGRRLVAEALPRGTIVRDGADVFRRYHTEMRDLRVEQFRALYLDGKHRVLRAESVSQGTLTSSPVHPREVFAPAVRHRAAAIVLVHNHPSGDPSPSADDLEITQRLSQVGELIGIRIVDHVIIGDGAYVSLADRGLLRR